MDNKRTFISSCLLSGLEIGVVTPDDVLRHLSPDVLAFHLPKALRAELLGAALGADKLDADLILKTLGIERMAEHLPPELAWALIEECTHVGLQGGTGKTAPIGTEPPLAPVPAHTRKPIRAATPRASTNEAQTEASALSPASVAALSDDGDSDFDVDTRVGEDIESDVGSEDSEIFEEVIGNEDLTAHGKE